MVAHEVRAPGLARQGLSPASVESRARRVMAMHCRVFGPTTADDRSTLLVLHGFTGSGESWSEIATVLGGAAVEPDLRLRVLAPDLPGHGRSPDPASSSSFESMADDLATLLDREGVQRPNLLGYSMGGRLALAFALRHPQRVRSLVLESTTAGLENAGERVIRQRADDALAARLENIGVDAFLGEWLAQPLFSTLAAIEPERRMADLAQRRIGRAAGLAASLRCFSVGREPALWGKLHGLRVPTLILSGALDQKYVVLGERLAMTLPDASHQTVAGIGHSMHLEDPDAFIKRLSAFLCQVRRREMDTAVAHTQERVS